jgi:hypothetical protein
MRANMLQLSQNTEANGGATASTAYDVHLHDRTYGSDSKDGVVVLLKEADTRIAKLEALLSTQHDLADVDSKVYICIYYLLHPNINRVRSCIT